MNHNPILRNLVPTGDAEQMPSAWRQSLLRFEEKSPLEVSWNGFPNDFVDDFQQNFNNMNNQVNKILNNGSGEAKIGNALMDFEVRPAQPPFNGLIQMFGRDSKRTNNFDHFLTTFCHSTYSNCVRKIVGYTGDDTVNELFLQWVREDLYLNTPIEGGDRVHAPHFNEDGEVIDWIDRKGFTQDQLLDVDFATGLFRLYPTITILFCDNVFPDGSGDTWAQTYSVVRSDSEGAPPATFYLDTSSTRTFEKTYDNLYTVLMSGCVSAVGGFGV